MMSVTDLLKFLNNYLELILAIFTIISFVGNIVQYKTNKNIQYILDTIFQTCFRTIQRHKEKAKSEDELIDIIYIIRDQSVSGLRSIGVDTSYGSFDGTTSFQRRGGILRDILRNIYHLLMDIRRKIPNLISGKYNTK